MQFNETSLLAVVLAMSSLPVVAQAPQLDVKVVATVQAASVSILTPIRFSVSFQAEKRDVRCGIYDALDVESWDGQEWQRAAVVHKPWWEAVPRELAHLSTRSHGNKHTKFVKKSTKGDIGGAFGDLRIVGTPGLYRLTPLVSIVSEQGRYGPIWKHVRCEPFVVEVVDDANMRISLGSIEKRSAGWRLAAYLLGKQCSYSDLVASGAYSHGGIAVAVSPEGNIDETILREIPRSREIAKVLPAELQLRLVNTLARRHLASAQCAASKDIALVELRAIDDLWRTISILEPPSGSESEDYLFWRVAMLLSRARLGDVSGARLAWTQLTAKWPRLRDYAEVEYELALETGGDALQLFENDTRRGAAFVRRAFKPAWR